MYLPTFGGVGRPVGLRPFAPVSRSLISYFTMVRAGLSVVL